MVIHHIRDKERQLIQCISLKDFCGLVHHSKQSIRRLIETGNRFRKLRAIRDGVHTYIPLLEVSQYPFVDKRGAIYHYDKDNPGEKYYED